MNVRRPSRMTAFSLSVLSGALSTSLHCGAASGGSAATDAKRGAVSTNIVATDAGGDAFVFEPSSPGLDASADAASRRVVFAFGGRDAGFRDAGAEAGTPDINGNFQMSKDAPDPEPILASTAWILALGYDKGAISLLGCESEALAKPARTARSFGRFALELYDDVVLVERVRFDFPLLAADDNAAVSLTRNLKTRIGVRFPQTLRGNRLELVDRKDNRRIALAWPPVCGE
jgi:hypothetical protein